MPRHPDATAAILITGVHPAIGGITGGPKSNAGMRELTADGLVALYGARTGMNTEMLKALPLHTDAPARPGTTRTLPRNDHDTLQANMPKAHAPLHTSEREHTHNRGQTTE